MTALLNVAYYIVLSHGATHLCLFGSNGSFGFLLDFDVLLRAGRYWGVWEMRNGARTIQRFQI